MANVGDYIKFGNYPQTANGDIQPIEWQILAKEENKMLLISKYALESKCFDNDCVKNWKKSEIRHWLNVEFYNKAFSENEKKLIRYSSISTEVEIKKKVGFGFVKSLFGEEEDFKFIRVSELTDDYIFLLSDDEVITYFSDEEDERKCKATEYARVKYVNINGIDLEDDGYCCWWLRSPGLVYEDAIDIIFDDGSFCGDACWSGYELVRPALWVNI